MSPAQIQQPGWQATLSYPQYANTSSSPWQNVVTACSADGYNSFLDATWIWGEAPFIGVDIACEGGNAIEWTDALEPIGIMVFSYDGNSMGNYDVLWCEWGRSQKTLTISSSSGGTTNPPPGTWTYNEGDNAVIIAIPAGSYSSGGYTYSFFFGDWSLNGALYTINGIIDENSTLTLPINANCALTAVFVEQVSGGPGGGGGCPYVYTWNGRGFVLDNNILAASEDGNGTDTKDYYKLEQPLVPITKGHGFSLYSLKISESENEQDYIDQVKLISVDYLRGTNIAVTSGGQIVTYANPTSPSSCVDDNGTDRLNQIRSMNGEINDSSTYFQGDEDNWLILNFGSVTASNANLIFRDDQKCMDVCINVQVPDSNGSWQTVEVLHPRDFWGMEAVNMTAFIPSNGSFIVRLYWTASHRLDYVGLDTSVQAQITINAAIPTLAFHSTIGDVTRSLQNDDENCVKLVNGQQITLTFILPNLSRGSSRSFILYGDGYYYTIT